jgi:hypothetical protein
MPGADTQPQLGCKFGGLDEGIKFGVGFLPASSISVTPGMDFHEIGIHLVSSPNLL